MEQALDMVCTDKITLLHSRVCTPCFPPPFLLIPVPASPATGNPNGLESLLHASPEPRPLAYDMDWQGEEGERETGLSTNGP